VAALLPASQAPARAPRALGSAPLPVARLEAPRRPRPSPPRRPISSQIGARGEGLRVAVADLAAPV